MKKITYGGPLGILEFSQLHLYLLLKFILEIISKVDTESNLYLTGITFDNQILGVVADGNNPSQKHWWRVSGNSNKGVEKFQIMNIWGSIPLMEWAWIAKKGTIQEWL